MGAGIAEANGTYTKPHGRDGINNGKPMYFNANKYSIRYARKYFFSRCPVCEGTRSKPQGKCLEEEDDFHTGVPHKVWFLCNPHRSAIYHVLSDDDVPPMEGWEPFRTQYRSRFNRVAELPAPTLNFQCPMCPGDRTDCYICFGYGPMDTWPTLKAVALQKILMDNAPGLPPSDMKNILGKRRRLTSKVADYGASPTDGSKPRKAVSANDPASQRDLRRLVASEAARHAC